MPSEVKPKKKIKKKFKLATFDKEVLKLVYDGVSKDAALQERTRVDEAQFKERILDLIEEGLLVRGADLQLRLGIEGYNTFVEKIKPKEKPTLQPSNELKQKIDAQNEKTHPPAPHIKPAEILPAGQEKITELVDIEGKVGRMDLEDIIKKYGPTPDQKNQFMQKLTPAQPTPQKQTQVAAASTKQIQELPAQAAAKTPSAPKIQMESNSADVCELCKAPFVLKVGDETQSKYGHCFCGAAYHKDCYDTILDDSRLCIRCGKKLMLLLDKNSRDTLNELRDAFE